MKKFKLTWKEIEIWEVTVEAETADEAKKMFEDGVDKVVDFTIRQKGDIIPESMTAEEVTDE